MYWISINCACNHALLLIWMIPSWHLPVVNLVSKNIYTRFHIPCPSNHNNDPRAEKNKSWEKRSLKTQTKLSQWEVSLNFKSVKRAFLKRLNYPQPFQGPMLPARKSSEVVMAMATAVSRDHLTAACVNSALFSNGHPVHANCPSFDLPWKEIARVKLACWGFWTLNLLHTVVNMPTEIVIQAS